MEFYANEKKKVEIVVNNESYIRHAVKTHFVEPGESYIDVIEKYVSPIYQEGDIISISEKIIALCQNRIVRREDVKKVSFLAKFLSKFASHGPQGPGLSDPFKMQVAIMLCGAPKVFIASIAGGIGKILGKKGWFYEIVGPEISGLDGFYPDAFEVYGNMGIRIPENSGDVCDEIKDKLGISCMIVDANDLGVEIYGKSKDILAPISELKELIKDNPAGQDNQLTPIILIRKEKKELE